MIFVDSGLHRVQTDYVESRMNATKLCDVAAWHNEDHWRTRVYIQISYRTKLRWSAFGRDFGLLNASLTNGVRRTQSIPKCFKVSTIPKSELQACLILRNNACVRTCFNRAETGLD